MCRCTQLLFDDSNTTRLKVTAIAQIVISLLHNFQRLEVGDVSEPHQNGCKEPAKHLRTDAHKHPLPPNVPHHCPRQCDRWIVKTCTYEFIYSTGVTPCQIYSWFVLKKVSKQDFEELASLAKSSCIDIANGSLIL